MKKNLVVLFGGQSSEHDVSCVSATTIVQNLDAETYNIIMIGITKTGEWLKADHVSDLANGEWEKSTIKAVILPDAKEKAVMFFDRNSGELMGKVTVSVVFPALHGLYGEDGTVQGLLELAQIPYVGCGVLASSVSMDKLYTKVIVDQLGIRQAKYVPVLRSDLADMEATADRVEKELGYPVYVKPSNAGSSIGVSKAENREALKKALLLANEHDRKILVEETIVGREVECAVLGKAGDVEASGVGEILAAAEFYDYEAKYHNPESKTVIDPVLPAGKAEEIAEDARKIFTAVDGFGLSRVDFFVENDTNEVVFNEINTLPGFTSISMYPMLWENKGVNKKALVTRLIELAMNR